MKVFFFLHTNFKLSLMTRYEKNHLRTTAKKKFVNQCNIIKKCFTCDLSLDDDQIDIFELKLQNKTYILQINFMSRFSVIVYLSKLRVMSH